MAVAVIITVTVGLLSVSHSSGVAYAELAADTAADGAVLNATSRLDEAFRYSIRETIFVATPTAVSFSTCLGWNGTAPIASAPMWLSFQDGRLMVDDVVVLEGLTSFEAGWVGARLRITMDLSVPVDTPGGGRTIDRRIVFEHRLES